MLVVGCLLVLAGTGAVGLALAHGTHATASPQTSADGTLVVEQAFLTEPGYLVVRADDGGEPGRVLGHRRVRAGLHTATTVSIADEHWATLPENATVWVVLHGDDGDGVFDSAADPLLMRFDQPAGDRIPVGKRDAPANVVVGAVDGVVDDGELVVSHVTLPAAGHVVVHRATADDLGPALGSRALPAGTRQNVTVPVDLPDADGDRPASTVAVHVDDGDGRYDPADDHVVRVAAEPVASTDSVPDRRPGTVGIVTPTDTGTGGSGRERTTPADDGDARDGVGLTTGLAAVALLGAAGLAGLLAYRRVRP